MAGLRRQSAGQPPSARSPADRMADLLASARDVEASEPSRGWTPRQYDHDAPEVTDTLSGRIARRIPAVLGGGTGRWSIRLGATVIVALIALLAGTYLAVRAVTEAPDREVRTVAPRPSAATGNEAPQDPERPDGSQAGEPSGQAGKPSGQSEFKIHVVGAVRKPGLVTVQAGSRVDDAIELAGGAAAGADLSRINLARQLVDGEQLYVPKVGEAAPGPPSAPASGPGQAPPSDGAAPGNPGHRDSGSQSSLVNLNTASATELDELPGVGPVTAEKIISWREANGGFTAIEDLMDVPGIGPKTFAELKDLVTV
ncbi:helix-hairpin-helix domain-containing protein [Saxibacter everestensis]|uniref:Helix-hairpin-helix domain-containing protein n=1 Tax=Saxibacter everestensis TaxID=2909229 RepID=A0ABY8R0A9_9MICO|nr:helix-hairpin-helix domain-containing protein [Brevibacteriaceae bacterium ZFBP1038]